MSPGLQGEGCPRSRICAIFRFPDHVKLGFAQRGAFLVANDQMSPRGNSVRRSVTLWKRLPINVARVTPE
jgi:hypothetical protein